MITSSISLSHKRKYLRLCIFTLAVILFAYLVVNFGLAWIYINALTKPACIRSPSLITETLAPQEHWLNTSDGRSLRLWYYPPQNGAVIVALGGMGGSLGNNLPSVKFLIDEGYGVLQIDSRACAAPPAPVTLGYAEEQDAAAGLEFLNGQPEVNRIGAMGFSMGGVTAIRTAKRHPEIMALVAEGGYYNLGDHIVKPENQSSLPRKVFLYSIAVLYWLQTGVNPWAVSPIDDLPGISPRPVLLIYGEHELSAGRGDMQYTAAGEPKELWIVPGGYHGTNHLISPHEYEARVLDFFRLNLTVP